MRGSLAATAAAAGAPVDGAAPPRRFLKQGRQYTGRPGVGRNGRLVTASQSVHTASWRCRRAGGRARVEDI
ncbi:MAG: hypothetical protein OXM56_07895 [Gammaproteobacteria bacterium]|nr:hypothetical protein [Gammaproteobacteria bacterium]